ncbi:MAG: ABC transporter ATP-binding protein [Firmicutes bacterium]|nr:ABC transporter ATP-binding protein [Bacillota bacterium]
MASNNSLLHIEDLHISFDTYRGQVRALNGVDLEIAPNEVVGLVGETGCGKSVTAFSVVGLLDEKATIDQGHIWFEGEDLTKKSEREMRQIRGKRIAMIYQEPATALNPVLSIEFQLAEVIRLHSKEKLDKAQVRDKALELLDAVALPDPKELLGKYPHELSGGQRQRVMIAMALSGRPALIIADEPTTALDVTTQAEILRLMKAMQEAYETSLLLVTHDLGVVAETCDRVGVMYAGNIVEVGNTEQIFEDARHPYTQGLLRAIPSIEERRAKLETIPGSVPNLLSPPLGCRFHPRCNQLLPICQNGNRPSLREIGPGHWVACHGEVN